MAALNAENDLVPLLRDMVKRGKTMTIGDGRDKTTFIPKTDLVESAYNTLAVWRKGDHPPSPFVVAGWERAVAAIAAEPPITTGPETRPFPRTDYYYTLYHIIWR